MSTESPDTPDPTPEQLGDAASDVIQLSGISKHYDGVVALNDVSCSIKNNEILAIVGDNGAGKSTLIKILAGVISPTNGELMIQLNGDLEPYSMDDPRDARSAGIETVFQDLGLSTKHDVGKNIFMGREPKKEGFKGKFLRRLDREQIDRRAIEALQEIGFRIDPNAPVSELSGGEQQAVAVARALITDPRIVLLDEPTAEVSVDGRDKILNLIKRMQSEGRTIVFITHNLEEVMEVADRIVVLRNGELVTVEQNDGSIDRRDLVGFMTGALDPNE